MIMRYKKPRYVQLILFYYGNEIGIQIRWIYYEGIAVSLDMCSPVPEDRNGRIFS